MSTTALRCCDWTRNFVLCALGLFAVAQFVPTFAGETGNVQGCILLIYSLDEGLKVLGSLPFLNETRLAVLFVCLINPLFFGAVGGVIAARQISPRASGIIALLPAACLFPAVLLWLLNSGAFTRWIPRQAWSNMAALPGLYFWLASLTLLAGIGIRLLLTPRQEIRRAKPVEQVLTDR
jgi:hypothetical protein